MTISVRHVRQADAESWLRMRCALWPEASEAEHRLEIERYLDGSARDPQAVLLAVERTGEPIGFAELTIRAYAESCLTNRVAYLEAWYVAPDCRRRGVAQSLVMAAEQWAIRKGCTEFASDTRYDNEIGEAAHKSCGFTEVEVIRCYKKMLSRDRV